jgi:hypothetical protein
MICGEEVIMFNERALRIEVGGFTRQRKGAQPKNPHKIAKR